MPTNQGHLERQSRSMRWWVNGQNRRAARLQVGSVQMTTLLQSLKWSSSLLVISILCHLKSPGPMWPRLCAKADSAPDSTFPEHKLYLRSSLEMHLILHGRDNQVNAPPRKIFPSVHHLAPGQPAISGFWLWTNASLIFTFSFEARLYSKITCIAWVQIPMCGGRCGSQANTQWISPDSISAIRATPMTKYAIIMRTNNYS